MDMSDVWFIWLTSLPFFVAFVFLLGSHGVYPIHLIVLCNRLCSAFQTLPSNCEHASSVHVDCFCVFGLGIIYLLPTKYNFKIVPRVNAAMSESTLSRVSYLLELERCSQEDCAQ